MKKKAKTFHWRASENGGKILVAKIGTEIVFTSEMGKIDTDFQRRVERDMINQGYREVYAYEL